MAIFNFHDYEGLKDNQVLKIKLKGKEEWNFVSHVSKDFIQSNQVNFTPITKINLQIVNEIELYKEDKEEYDNYSKITLDPGDIVEFELIEF